MKQVKFQRNLFIMMLISLIVLSITFVITTIIDQFYWQSLIAIVYMIVCTIERYNKYVNAKINYEK